MAISAKGCVIHFTARSGSTFLIFTLRRHPKITMRAEVFGAKRLPGDIEQTADNQIAFLRRFFRPYRLTDRQECDRANAFKVQISPDNTQIKAIGRYAKVLSEYDVAKIFLYRKNSVKQIISSLRAQQVMKLHRELGRQESAHVYDNEVAEKLISLPKLMVPPVNLNRRLHNLKRSYHLMKTLKEKIGSDLDIYYEDILENRQATFDKIFGVINVPSIDVSKSDEVKKITSERLSDVIENYDELLKYFEGTEYYEQFV